MTEAASTETRACEWLVLVPTQLENDLFRQAWFPRADNSANFGGQSWIGQSVCLETCGFGLIVPAAQTVRLIQRYCPRQVVLCGIAGSYDQTIELGKAYLFSEVACCGIGVGCGSQHQSASDLGWWQWPGDEAVDQIGDRIDLSIPRTLSGEFLETHLRPLVLSVTAAAGDLRESEQRSIWFPQAGAEEMEGFGVAVACHCCQVSLTIVRGISNLAGDRIKSNWRIGEAMASAVALVRKLTSESTTN